MVWAAVKGMAGYPSTCAAVAHGSVSFLATQNIVCTCRRLAAATRGEALASLAGLSGGGGGGGGTPRAAEQGSGLAGLSGLGAEGIASLAAATATEVRRSNIDWHDIQLACP